jgi:hypothetical protein
MAERQDHLPADVPEWVLPPKEEVYSAMEALIWHFKIVMGETEVPVGEVYHCVEGGNGELGFYLVSDGGRTPFRLHLPPAVLHLLSGLPRNDQRQHVERCDPHHEQHERDRWRTGRMMRRTETHHHHRRHAAPSLQRSGTGRMQGPDGPVSRRPQ